MDLRLDDPDPRIRDLAYLLFLEVLLGGKWVERWARQRGKFDALREWRSARSASSGGKGPLRESACLFACLGSRRVRKRRGGPEGTAPHLALGLRYVKPRSEAPETHRQAQGGVFLKTRGRGSLGVLMLPPH